MIWAVCLVGRTGYRMIDEILIKKLVPELIEDYFDFFDNRAFSDGSPIRVIAMLSISAWSN